MKIFEKKNVSSFRNFFISVISIYEISHIFHHILGRTDPCDQLRTLIFHLQMIAESEIDLWGKKKWVGTAPVREMGLRMT
jgi:hypothetical protein